MQSDSIVPQLLLQLVLILINALFSATEIAMISLNENKLKKLAEGGDGKAVKLLKMVAEPTGFLSAIQIGITLAGFLGSAFAADNFSHRLVRFLTVDCGLTALPASALNTLSVLLITLILSYFTLVLGELVPKRIAMKKPDSIANAMCSLIHGLSIVLRPLIWLLTVSTNGILRLFGFDPKEAEEDVSEEEIIMMLDIGEENGTIEAGEKEMIKNVFSLNDMRAGDVMVHRSCVTFLWADNGREEILNTVMETGFSRFPVCGKDTDDIIGILYAKQYLTDLQLGKAPDLRSSLLPVQFIPENARINSVLVGMQRDHRHMEIVVDEFGGVVGLITMEDILEELVGDIWDESDEVIEEFTRLDNGQYKILCSADLDRLQTLFDLEIDSEADTVSGWVIEQLGHIPSTGERFTYDNLTVEVTSTDSKRVLEITVIVGEKTDGTVEV